MTSYHNPEVSSEPHPAGTMTSNPNHSEPHQAESFHKVDFANMMLFTDFQVALKGGFEMPFHRELLIASSDFFRGFCTYNPSKRRVELPEEIGTEPKHLRALHNMLYHPRRSTSLRWTTRRTITPRPTPRRPCTPSTNSLTYEEATEVFLLADHLGFDGIATKAREFLKEHLCSEHRLEIIIFASHFPSLTQSLAPVVASRLDELLGGLSEASLGTIPFDILLTVLESEYAYAEKEFTIWTLIKSWVLQQPEKLRKRYLDALLPQLRIGLFPFADFYTAWNSFKEITGDEGDEIFSRWADFLEWRRNGSQEKVEKKISQWPMEDKMRTMPRLPPNIILTLGGFSFGGPCTNMELYNPKLDSWVVTPKMKLMPEARAYFGCVALNRSIIIFGGVNAQGKVSSTMKLDLDRLKWTQLGNMCNSRCFIKGEVYNGEIYTFGGMAGDHQATYQGDEENPPEHRMRSTERYSPERNQWTRLEDMDGPRSDYGTAVDEENHCIYVVGGFTGLIYLSTVKIYFPRSNTWENAPSMKQERGGLGCAIVEGKLYAIGGYEGGEDRLRSVEYLDLRYNLRGRLGEWKSAPDMLETRSNFALTVTDSKNIVVCGGYNEGPPYGDIAGTIVDCEWFDGKEWHMGDDFPRLASAHSMISVPTTKALIEQARSTHLKEAEEEE